MARSGGDSTPAHERAMGCADLRRDRSLREYHIRDGPCGLTWDVPIKRDLGGLRMACNSHAVSAAAALLILGTGALMAQTHRRIDVGGHRLDYVLEGAGEPAVVFETGLADSLDTWLPLLRSVSEYTTAIAYSRAGFGRSESGAPDHSVAHAVADLHALLHQLPIRPPFVLVARSYGSLIARLYISLYPTDVAGLVLVDGTHEQQVQRFGAVDSTYPAAFRAHYDSVLAQLPAGPEA